MTKREERQIDITDRKKQTEKGENGQIETEQTVNKYSFIDTEKNKEKGKEKELYRKREKS